jgi:hypothetical protein
MAEKKVKLSGAEQVAQYLQLLDHPLKQVVVRLREIIGQAHPALTEHIKWNAPSFCHNGDDRITFNVHKNDSVLIVFHRGAKAKDRIDTHTLINDSSKLLQWQSPDRALASFTSIAQVEQHKTAIRQIVNDWIAAAAEV